MIEGARGGRRDACRSGVAACRKSGRYTVSPDRGVRLPGGTDALTCSALPLAIACACLVATSCSLLDKLDKKDSSSSPTPTSPSPTVGMGTFAGTWSSVSASTPATGCGNVQYTVTPASSSTATVSFVATCGGNINVNGAGTGSISGLDARLVGQRAGEPGRGQLSVHPHQRHRDTGLDGNVAIHYGGTVCGIPVSGTETVEALGRGLTPPARSPTRDRRRPTNPS